jgi:hypothetical protein
VVERRGLALFPLSPPLLAAVVIHMGEGKANGMLKKPVIDVEKNIEDGDGGAVREPLLQPQGHGDEN